MTPGLEERRAETLEEALARASTTAIDVVADAGAGKRPARLGCTWRVPVMPTDDALIESLALELHRLRDEVRQLPTQVEIPAAVAPLAERLFNVSDRLNAVELLVLRLVGHPEPAPEGERPRLRVVRDDG